jgi:hypothetical protein
MSIFWTFCPEISFRVKAVPNRLCMFSDPSGQLALQNFDVLPRLVEVAFRETARNLAKECAA